MSTEGMNQYFQSTIAGALVQAIDQAAKADRLARQDMRSRNARLDAGFYVIALWRRLLRPACALGAIILAVALSLDIFSD